MSANKKDQGLAEPLKQIEEADEFDDDSPPRGRSIRALVAAVLINLVIGCGFAFGNANLYVAKRLGRSQEETIVVMQIWALTQFVFAFVGLLMMEKLGPWLTNFISILGFALVQLTASFITNYYAFIFFYGIVSGAFIGIGSIQALYVALTHFVNHKTIITGVVLFFAGMSPSFMGPLTTMFANPDNLRLKDPRLADRMPHLFQMYALIYGGVGLVGSALLPQPWEGKHQKEIEEAQREQEYMAEVKDEQTEGQPAKPVLLSEGKPNTKKNNAQSQLSNFAMGHHLTFMVAKPKTQRRLTDLLQSQLRYHRLTEIDQKSLSEFKRAEPSSIEKIDNPPLLQDQSGLQQAPQTKESAGKTPTASKSLKNSVISTQDDKPTNLKEAVKTMNFWMLLLMVYGVSVWNNYVCSNWKFVYELHIEHPVTDRELSHMTTYGALSTSFVALTSGILVMKLEWPYLYWFMSLLTIFSAFSFGQVMNSYGFGALYIVLGSGCLGIENMIFSIITTRLFGFKVGPLVYPFVLLMRTLANFSQHFFFRYYEKSPESLQALYYTFGFVCLLSLSASVWVAIRESSWKSQRADMTAEDEEETDNTVPELVDIDD